tara:strand:+ start:633 stop:1328 length:696 start_codon:yes stop_codon:yes gene_type:complete
MNFELYGFEHMAYIYAMALCCAVIPFVSNKFLSNVNQRVVAILLVIAIIGVEIIDDIYRVFDSSVGWDIKTDLPLHMCGFSVFATSWALLKRNQIIFELCYFWGLGGAIQAILTPDTTGFHGPFYLFTFMASHGLIVLNVFYLIFVYKMILNKGALLRTIIITNIMLIGIAIINWILDANYFYLFRAPDVNNPLILTNQQPFYFMNMEFVAIIVLYIISIPMLIYRKKIEH